MTTIDGGSVAAAALVAAAFAFGATRVRAQEPLRVDTVRVTKSVLARALSDSTACISPDAGRGLWSAPPGVVQAGAALVMSDGRVTVIDRDAGALRVYDADGRELHKLGRRGAGPGEFSARAQPMHWGGDTIAVSDPDNSRVVLFADGRFATAVNLAAAGSMARVIPHGRDERGGLLFWTGNPARTDLGSPYRSPYRLVRWRPDDAAPVASVIREGILGIELHVVQGPERPIYATVNFARTTSIAALHSEIAVYDHARPVITIMNWNGQSLRALALEVTDPPVSAVQRDSVLRQVNASPAPVNVAALDAVRRWIPPTRTAATWRGVDAGDGIWLTFHPPVATGTAVHMRITSTGIPTHCYRASPNTKTIAFAPDRVVTVVEGDEGDVINVERAVPYPTKR